METEKKHVWHRVEPTALLLTVIIVPLAVWWATSRSEGDKTRLEYVRLAIGILQPPEKDQRPQKELRSWAVQVLQNTSPVKLSPDTTQALIDGAANLTYVSSSAPTPYYTGKIIMEYDSNGSLKSSHPEQVIIPTTK